MSSVDERILSKYWDLKAPVDVLGIASKMGIHVETAPSSEQTVSSVDQHGDRRIILADGMSLLRQRFAIAHALGHHVLGHVRIGNPVADDVRCYSEGVDDQHERDANDFALKVMAPRIALVGLVQNRGIVDIRRLSDLLLVSEVGIVQRLRDLRMLGPAPRLRL
jgi:Zn-dependent peptidase ImmA (M78 family)